MATFQWTLDNTAEGTLVLTNDPIGWDEVDLILERDLDYHGIFQEWAFDLEFHCEGGGKEYIDNIYETQGVDALVTFLIEYACPDGTLETLFDGKLNLSKYVNKSIDSSEVTTQVQIVRNDITQNIRDGQDIKINLNELFTLAGTAMNAYTFAPALINVGSQIIDLQNRIDHQGIGFSSSDTFPWTFPVNANRNIFIQHDDPVVEDDLELINDNPDFSNDAPGLAINVSGVIPFYDSSPNDLLTFPETYNLTWDFSGFWNDCADVASTRNIVTGIRLQLAYGQDLANLQFVNIGVLAIGAYPTGAICPATLSIPFAFVGGAAITVQKDDKFWLMWFVNGYIVTAGPGVLNITIRVDYATDQLIAQVASSNSTPGINSGFALYETWARVCESLSDQVSFAFRSNLYGRTDAEPNVGGAPTYLSDGCGAFNFIFSGLSLRFYAQHKLQPLKPDFMTLKELFDGCDSIHNIGLGVETFGGQDVIRVEEKDFFYSAVSMIQLSGVTNLEWRIDTSFIFNEFEIGFEQWEPENFNGLDEINTKHEYNEPITTVKNKLSRLSPILASGYAIEDIKRVGNTQRRDKKYDNNNFFLAVRRILATFEVDNDQDFSATAALGNPSTRRNIKLTPKHNFLRWLNVIGSGLEKTAGATIDFREGDANVYFTTTVDPVGLYFGCNGDYTGNLLNEDGDIAWDDVNARLNAPLWRPEVYEFDAPLSYTEYKAIRDAPTGFIEFRSGTTGTFKQGFILNLKFRLRDGLTHFKLLRRHT